MLHFEPNQKQKNALQGLAYWIADEAHMREKYGDNEPELQTCKDTIQDIFASLDDLCVPFWVQNKFICFAENWRAYIANGTDKLFKEIA